MKSKTTGPKSSKVNLKNKAAAKSSRTPKIAVASVKTKSGTTLSAVKGTKTTKLAATGKPRAVVAPKVSVAERLSTSRLVKKADVIKLKSEKAANLKLVAKGGTKAPATKISRSEPAGLTSKVITGKFSVESTPMPVNSGHKNIAVAKMGVHDTKTPQLVVDNSNQFKAGDKIVYPGHGVGEIEEIRSTVLGGQEHHIYNIKILDSGMKVMVPVSQASAVGLRKIIGKKAIDEVFSILRDRDFKIDTQTWNRRFREYSQKIKTGSVFEIAIVLRDLLVLSADKELSFGEKKMLDTAETLLVSEISIAKARPHDKVVGELRALFA